VEYLAHVEVEVDRVDGGRVERGALQAEVALAQTQKGDPVLRPARAELGEIDAELVVAGGGAGRRVRVAVAALRARVLVADREPHVGRRGVADPRPEGD